MVADFIQGGMVASVIERMKNFEKNLLSWFKSLCFKLVKSLCITVNHVYDILNSSNNKMNRDCAICL